MRASWAPFLLFLAVRLASGTFPSANPDLDLETARLFFSNEICGKHVDHCRRAMRALALTGDDFDAALASAPDRKALVNAFLQNFDAHARVETAPTAGRFREFNGLGFDSEISDAGIVVRRVYPGTPAATALKPNDRLLEIEGVSVEPGPRATAALDKLARLPGQRVRLTVERTGVVRSLSLPIARLRLPEVRVEILGADLARVEIRQFGAGVCAEVRSKIPTGTTRFLLDLRGNPGGSVPEAECVYGLFADGRMIERRALPKLLPFDLPAAQDAVVPTSTGEFRSARITILVNAFTASAAEMLAAALQDRRRAWVVGQTTFGKGTTQAQITRGNARLIYTVSRYYRPSGLPLQLVGVTPDFPEPFRVGEDDRVFPREAAFFPGTLAREQAPAPASRKAGRLRQCAGARADRWIHADRQTAFGLGVLACT